MTERVKSKVKLKAAAFKKYRQTKDEKTDIYLQSYEIKWNGRSGKQEQTLKD